MEGLLKNILEYFLHHFNNSKDNCSSLFKGEYHGDLDNISYPRFVRDEWGFEGIIFLIIGILVERKVDL